MERKDYIALLIGLTSAIKIRIVGTFYASELILVFLYLFADVWLYKENKTAKKTIFLSIVWLFGVVASDFFNNTEELLFWKGFVSTLLLVLELPIVYWILSDRPYRYFYFLLGAGIASVPSYLIFGNPNDGLYGTEVTIWLFYSMIPLAYAVIGWLANRGVSNKIIYTLILTFAFFVLTKGCRNIFLSFLLAFFYLLFANKILRLPEENIMPEYQRKWGRLLILLVFGAFVISEAYGYLAMNGYLGEDGRAKYVLQKSQKNGIISGREATIMGVAASIERPLFGYGSYPMDKDDAFYTKYVTEHGLDYIASSGERYMPGHSHLVGTWVCYGMFGGLFWLYVIYIMFLFIKRGKILKDRSLVTIVSLVFFGWVWDICFSPFWDRVGISFFVMYMILQLSNNDTEEFQLLDN